MSEAGKDPNGDQLGECYVHEGCNFQHEDTYTIYRMTEAEGKGSAPAAPAAPATTAAPAAPVSSESIAGPVMILLGITAIC